MVTPAGPNPIDAPGTDEQAWRAWPRLRRFAAADIRSWTSVLILAAHPDDEVLGVGGTICVLARAGARLRLVAVTDGEASHPGITRPGELAERRTAETSAALRALGASTIEVVRLRLPDTGLTTRQHELAGVLRELGQGFDVCLAPWEKDVHADHEAVGRAARQAHRELAFYPVWTWHWSYPGDRRVPWSSAVRVPLPASAVASKRAAIGCFASQLEDRAGAGPVLTPGMLAHFTRDAEVLFPRRQR